MAILSIIALVIQLIFKIFPLIFHKAKLQKMHEVVAKTALELKGQKS